ncbi:MAG: hypothetical protein VKI81_00445 [Synechococcaceae cyanobacterium]|nr:hypothetical protein [Synechococcaceae cyanobacterium]
MGNRPSCRSCRHCTPPSGVELGWCQLRELPIHPELVGELWCHHWTSPAPRLPVMAGLGGGASEELPGGNQQLSLVSMLQEL